MNGLSGVSEAVLRASLWGLKQFSITANWKRFLFSLRWQLTKYILWPRKYNPCHNLYCIHVLSWQTLKLILLQFTYSNSSSYFVRASLVSSEQMTLKFVIELWKCIERVIQLSSVRLYISVSYSMYLNSKIAWNFVNNMHIVFFGSWRKKWDSLTQELSWMTSPWIMKMFYFLQIQVKRFLSTLGADTSRVNLA